MKRSYLITIIVLAIIAAVLILIFAKPRTPTKNEGDYTQAVTVLKVSEKNIPLRVFAVGNVIAPDTVMLKARTDGIVTKVNFKPGQYVQKGALLVVLQNEKAKADLSNAKALYDQARIKFNRYQALAKSDDDAVAKETLDEYRSTMNAAYATVKAKQQALKDTKIYAPFSGFIGSLESIPNSVSDGSIGSVTEVTVGAYLESGDPIVILSNPSHVLIQYQVSQKYSRYLKTGLPVNITSAAYPKTIFKGSVASVSPVVYQNSRSYEVRADIDNSKHLLKSGMIVFVQQVLQKDRKVLSVPGLSLVPTFMGYSVYTIEDSKVQQTPVKIGQRYGTYVEVTSGLKTGDAIINSNVSNLQPGESVKVQAK